MFSIAGITASSRELRVNKTTAGAILMDFGLQGY